VSAGRSVRVGRQPEQGDCVSEYVTANTADLPPPAQVSTPAEAVTALYQAHALGLIRLAVVMLGDRPAAEDVVQEAFCGLYRRWHSLFDTGKALSYVRSSVINGCRTVLRRRRRQGGLDPSTGDPPSESAEAAALISEEHRQVLTAIRRLPARQREALVLRFYLDLDEEEIAASMRISRGTVKSTTSRALAALGRILGEQS
jgi:RNA polymerase sigma-70 factor (sigma-E family)